MAVFCACKKDEPPQGDYPDTHIAVGTMREDTVVTDSLQFGFIGEGDEISLTVLRLEDYSIEELIIPRGVSVHGKIYRVTEIADKAFYGGDMYGSHTLTSVIIPQSVTRIGFRAFARNFNLNNIIIPNSVTSIGYSAFSYCHRLTTMRIPESVTNIESSVFYNCRNLTSVILPSTLTNIPSETFSGCSALTNIIIPDPVTTIERYAFAYCEELANVVIPVSVEYIGDSAFYHCDRLTSVTIPKSVFSIGFQCFQYCPIKTVDISWDIPIYIDEETFDFDGVETLFVPKGTRHIYAEVTNWKRFPSIIEK